MAKEPERYREIFNQLKNSSNFRYTNKQIAKWSGFDPSKLSRFFSGKRDLDAGEFFYLLESMPAEFQQEFWHQFNRPQSSLHHLNTAIEDMDLTNLGILMQSIGAEIKRTEGARK